MPKKKLHGTGCYLFVVIAFGFAVLSTSLGFIFKGKSYLKEFLDEGNDGINLDALQGAFIMLIIATVFFVYINFIQKNKEEDEP